MARSTRRPLHRPSASRSSGGPPSRSASRGAHDEPWLRRGRDVAGASAEVAPHHPPDGNVRAVGAHLGATLQHRCPHPHFGLEHALGLDPEGEQVGALPHGATHARRVACRQHGLRLDQGDATTRAHQLAPEHQEQGHGVGIAEPAEPEAGGDGLGAGCPPCRVGVELPLEGRVAHHGVEALGAAIGPRPRSAHERIGHHEVARRHPHGFARLLPRPQGKSGARDRHRGRVDVGTPESLPHDLLDAHPGVEQGACDGEQESTATGGRVTDGPRHLEAGERLVDQAVGDRRGRVDRAVPAPVGPAAEALVQRAEQLRGSLGPVVDGVGHRERRDPRRAERLVPAGVGGPPVVVAHQRRHDRAEHGVQPEGGHRAAQVVERIIDHQ